MPKFVATIDKIGINPFVEPPVDVLNAIFNAAGRDKGPLRVKGTINGYDLKQTLVRYQSRWRLYINGDMCRSAGVGVGDTVRIVLEFDPEPREDLEPEILTTALDADSRARQAFDALTRSRRHEIICYLRSLKTDDAVTRNIAKVMRQLTESSE